MTTPVQQMIAKYDCKNTAEYKNALKEVIQEVALCGLSRGGFFKKAAFYGGTLTHLLKIMPANEKVLGVPGIELVKIKFEIDTNPPKGAEQR